MKIIKKTLKFVAALIILCIAYIVLNEGTAFLGQNSIKKNYQATKYDYIYMEKCENAEDISDMINEILEDLPEKYANEFKSKWLVVISPTPILDSSYSSNGHSEELAGLTLSSSKTVWISSNKIDFCKPLFLHEFGHFLAFELGSPDYSEDFITLYKNNKDAYLKYGTSTVDDYETSTSNEFFAMLCEEYFQYPDYLEENFELGYVYIDNLVNKNPYSTFCFKYFYEFKSTFFIFKSKVKSIIKT